MGIKDLKKILEQVHEPDEYQLTADNLSDPNYYIWKLENAKMKDLNLNLRNYRPEHARFDIFINGQYILEKDYILEHDGKNFIVKFIRANFPYTIRGFDDIKIEGDIDLVWVRKNLT